jgi:acetyl-CoA carboxylase carboxyl transferase subunit alpha
LAESLKLTSAHLHRLGVIDTIISEPRGGAHRDPAAAAHSLEQYISKTLRDLKRCKIDNLVERRYQKFRDMGQVLQAESRARAAM